MKITCHSRFNINLAFFFFLGGGGYIEVLLQICTEFLDAISLYKLYRRLCARQQWLHCLYTGVTAALREAIGIYLILWPILQAFDNDTQHDCN